MVRCYFTQAWVINHDLFKFGIPCLPDGVNSGRISQVFNISYSRNVLNSFTLYLSFLVVNTYCSSSEKC